MTSFLLLFLILFFFPPTIPIRAQALRATPSAPRSQKIRADRKLEREIRAAEHRLLKAIQKRDSASLDLLLADYYSDAYEGREQAIGKRATLAKCKRGTLHYYEIERGWKLTVRVDLVQVEGMANEEVKPGTDSELASDVHVMRLWTRQNGGWQLIGQTLGPPEDESKEK